MKAFFLLSACCFSTVLFSQNVGIGTATPGTKLHVSGTSANIATFSGGAGMWITLAEGVSNRGYIGSFSGNAEDVDFGTYGDNNTGKVHLTTANTPRLTVTPAGNIGIGITNPNQMFSVAAGMNIDQNDANSGTPVNALRFGGNGSGEAIGSRRTPGANQWGLDFYTNSAQRMSITLGGNVGIGTNTPSQKLHINGAIKISDASGPPTEGIIRFNTVNKDFEGYTGTEWKSLTITGNFLPLDMDTVANSLSDESFGYSVKAAGDWLFVGTPFDNVSGAADRGSVTVYKKNSINGKYEKYQTLLAPGGLAGDQFGYSLEVYHVPSFFTILLAGAPYSDVGGTTNQGAVFVFYFDPLIEFFVPNTPPQPAYIVSPSPTPGSGFGKSIDASDILGSERNYLLIGAPDKTVGGNPFQGEVICYEFDVNEFPGPPGPFVTLGRPTYIISNPSPAPFSYFGASVCNGKIKIFDSTTNAYVFFSRNFLIGSPGTTVNANANQGKVFVFQRNPAIGNIELDTSIIGLNGNAGDSFGSDIYYEEQYLQYFISAPDKESGANNQQGMIYVFRDSLIRNLPTSTRNGWIQKATVTAPDGAASDRLGKKIFFANGFLFAGAVNRDDMAPNAGAVYVFQKQSGFINYNYTFRKKITDLFGQNGDMLGDSFDINGNQIIIGIPNYDAPGRFNSGKIIFSSIF